MVGSFHFIGLWHHLSTGHCGRHGQESVPVDGPPWHPAASRGGGVITRSYAGSFCSCVFSRESGAVSMWQQLVDVGEVFGYAASYEPSSFLY